MAELAQTLFIHAGNQTVPVVEALSTNALAIDPNNVMALSLMGIVAFNAQKYVEAIEFWQRASALLTPNNADIATLQDGIAQARARLAVSHLMDSEVTQADSASSQNAKTSSSITVAVSLADDIDFQPDQPVFVYARAWQGSKMPLAIAKLRASQLPLTIILDESMAMSPSMTLSSVEQLELVARLSLSGEPIPKTGDWQTNVGPITLAKNQEVYPLVINQRIY